MLKAGLPGLNLRQNRGSFVQLKIGEWLRKYLDRTLAENETTTMSYPPPIAKTIGFELIEIGQASATLKMQTDPAIHGNPMGTVHGGVLCDIADAAIGTAHATTLAANESFTTIDLRINFFRPLWKDEIRATAQAVQQGRTVSFYSCDIARSDGKLVAVVTSSVMTLRGEHAKGR
jgi:uncharacterized protein (TIGR00369 family)